MGNCVVLNISNVLPQTDILLSDRMAKIYARTNYMISENRSHKTATGNVFCQKQSTITGTLR